MVVPTGAPAVANLDSDKLDGEHKSYYTNAANMSAGLLPLARLASSGTPSASTFLRGDRMWAPAPVVSYDLKTSGTRVVDGTLVGYKIEHNLGISNYCVQFVNRRGAPIAYQDYPTSGLSEPDIIRINIELNSVTVWFEYDIDYAPSPIALAVGDIRVFLIIAA